ncbi:replicative DNA helicase [Longispora fulva]|uniref:Replicative DNA helicase n=1 Tax=Longispora fulva TaxID=619741 RepID=A0A8J7GLN1_9ACTN|nr:replicative DNA helicase [Longispora fulva]MBG6140516.1 replicative DNA helicase [Longispora fulva]GIG57102.1 replicative DNA helicase [Longispora fulva]
MSEFNEFNGFDRTPPNNKDAEQIVLGALLLSPNAILDVTDIVSAADFYNPKHSTIFAAVLTRSALGEPTDPVAVGAHLLAQGELERVGGIPYLHTLVASVPTAANAPWYARLVAELAERRRLIEAGTRIVGLGYNPQVEADVLADQATEALYGAVDQRVSTDAQRLSELIGPTFDAIEAAGRRTGLVGLSTGLADLDRLTHGLQDGHVWLIAGRPGMGKSVAVVSLARSVAINQRKPVLVFSLEMSKQEIMTRLLSAESGVPTDRLLTGKLTDGEWSRITQVGGRVDDAPMFVIDDPDLTLLDIRTRARRLARRHGLALIVIDYLQLMGTSGPRRESREREVAEISRGLKLLAKEMACPVVAAAQLNRGPEQRTDRVPQLGDLRESGALEQDCDAAILLHRPDYYDPESHRPGEADFILAKHRGGNCGVVTVAAQLGFSRFVDMAPASR